MESHFPLKLHPRSKTFLQFWTVVKHIESLAEEGVFNTLFSSRWAFLDRYNLELFPRIPSPYRRIFVKFSKASKFPQPHQEVGLSAKRTILGGDVKMADEEPPNNFYSYDKYG